MEGRFKCGFVANCIVIDFETFQIKVA